eukprot:TRINITY_DN18263_c0_g1_i1.p1 TRINITY_DN18263_c0_g1~~TRINITY_DN18263_c0_g1_i1.p1  ORF type:complete len:335 (+),score=54.78 TRINITY_DN18263_c0_g1_i1:183-1187(+)
MDTAWIHTVSQSAHQEFPARMFVFPYAGGNSADFKISAFTSLKLDVHVLSYPGRGRRWKEDNYTDAESLSNAVISELREAFGVNNEEKVPFIFVGYSMGALVAYEVARKLQRDYQISPSLLVVVADEAPQTQKAFAKTDVNDAAFTDELRSLNLISDEILNDKEMLAMVLPSLKSDMMIENDYSFIPCKLECPITAVCGTKDNWVDEEKMSSWGDLTTCRYEYVSIPDAGHLFLTNPSHAAILRSVIQRCATTLDIIKTPPKGDEEQIQIKRVESSAPVKLLGNCWVKWNKDDDVPEPKPATYDSTKPQGLGAWYSDVKQQLQLRGVSLQPCWG